MKSLLALAAGPRRLLILIYHRVLPEADPLLPDTPTAAVFERHLKTLTRLFSPMSLREGAERLTDGSLPGGAVAVTFDDGYADNAEVAVPLLARYGVPATFFVATGFLDGGIMFNDRITEAVRRARGTHLHSDDPALGDLPVGTCPERLAAIARLQDHVKYTPFDQRGEVMRRLGLDAAPVRLMMSSQQVRDVHRAGMEVGAHTVNHPILETIDDSLARQEIVDSKRRLEALVQGNVTSFAYPNGMPGMDFSSRHEAMVAEAGFALAVTTLTAAATSRYSRFALPRTGVWRNDGVGMTAQLLRCARRSE